MPLSINCAAWWFTVYEVLFGVLGNLGGEGARIELHTAILVLAAHGPMLTFEPKSPRKPTL